MKKNITVMTIIFFTLLLLLFFPFAQPENPEQAGFEAEILVGNLDTPWAIAFLPDDTMLFTERGGRISLFDGNNVTIIAEIPVAEVSESGLLGIAVDPEFEQNNYVYTYHTYQHANGSLLNRVSRFTLTEHRLTDETVLLDRIPGARFHDGGRIKFGADGKLYITTGDATNPTLAQDTDSLAGKILRINKDGTIPVDNPFNNPVYSYGHRNPQGIAWHPETKEMYSSEHGPSRKDEINLITRGDNYGWPADCTDTTVEQQHPLRCYTEFTLAPSGIAFHDNELYIASLRGTQLRKITFGTDHKTILREEELFSGSGRIREVVEHKGYLYISTNNKDGRGVPRNNDDKIIKIKKIEVK